MRYLIKDPASPYVNHLLNNGWIMWDGFIHLQAKGYVITGNKMKQAPYPFDKEVLADALIVDTHFKGEYEHEVASLDDRLVYLVDSNEPPPFTRLSNYGTRLSPLYTF